MLRRGRGVLQGGNGSYALRAGDFGLLAPGADGSVKAAPDAEALVTCLLFPSERVEVRLSLGARLVFRHAAHVSRGAKVLPGSSALGRQMEVFLERAALSEDGELKTSDDLNAIVPLFRELAEFLIAFRRSTGGTPDRMFAVLESINESVLQGLSVDDLARRCGCSRRHLSRLVREHCDCSLASIRIELRLDKAADILRTTHNKVIDVAMECGFNHVGSFTSKFRRRFGVTPGKWRKKFAETWNLGDPTGPSHGISKGATGRRVQSE